MPNHVSTAERPAIGYVGQSCSELRLELARRNLSTRDLTIDSAMQQANSDLRVVIIPFVGESISEAQQQLKKQLLRLLPTLLDRGTELIVLTERREDIAPAVYVKDDLIKPQDRDLVQVGSYAMYELAQACSEMPSERLINHNLTISSPAAMPELRESEKALLKRAFNDFHRIDVTDLIDTGSTTRRVFRVDAFTQDGSQPEPFTAKIGLRKEIRVEIGNNADFCLESIPFPNLPPIIERRCVSGANRSAMISQFIYRATRLDRFIQAASAGLVIASLFDGPLRNWRSRLNPGEILLATELQAVLPQPASKRLGQAYEAAASIDRNVLKPSDLFSLIHSLKSTKVPACHSHGDLHVKNIFVRENATDVILIDVARSSQAVVTRDPATLEVSIAFDCPTSLPGALLRDLYKPGILCRQLMGYRDGQIRAIEQIRIQARASCNPDAYDLTAAFFLLRMARKYKNADAYLCAAELLSSVD